MTLRKKNILFGSYDPLICIVNYLKIVSDQTAQKLLLDLNKIVTDQTATHQ